MRLALRAAPGHCCMALHRFGLVAVACSALRRPCRCQAAPSLSLSSQLCLTDEMYKVMRPRWEGHVLAVPAATPPCAGPAVVFTWPALCALPTAAA